jgi:hypothetical protein
MLRTAATLAGVLGLPVGGGLAWPYVNAAPDYPGRYQGHSLPTTKKFTIALRY